MNSVGGGSATPCGRTDAVTGRAERDPLES
jgi:hypothetical protein